MDMLKWMGKGHKASTVLKEIEESQSRRGVSIPNGST